MIKQPHYHIGIAVPDIEAAIDELSAALGLSWTEPLERHPPGHTIRVAFSKTAEPFIELLEAPPGSIWDSTGGPYVHHIGYWSTDVRGDSDRLAAEGLPIELDVGRARYHGAPSSGMRIELIDGNQRPALLEEWGLGELAS